MCLGQLRSVRILYANIGESDGLETGTGAHSALAHLFNDNTNVARTCVMHAVGSAGGGRFPISTCTRYASRPTPSAPSLFRVHNLINPGEPERNVRHGAIKLLRNSGGHNNLYYPFQMICAAAAAAAAGASISRAHTSQICILTCERGRAPDRWLALKSKTRAETSVLGAGLMFSHSHHARISWRMIYNITY